ncbi:MAG: Phosphatidylglycerophosphatase A [Clostridia bacterium 41_269]|nr:MAG: Phosphatidylglycerophosphatase A [Clostridia bacterium 41_269]
MEKLIEKKLAERGVSIEKIAEIVYVLQERYVEGLTLMECREAVRAVFKKREVQHAVLTGIALDILAEKNALPSPLLEIIRNDESLYGIDEVLAFAITNVYGSIGLTNFGYLDKTKLGIIGELNNGKNKQVNTFLDDLIAAIAAAASARLAHSIDGNIYLNYLNESD